jgi:hypothetical protein
MKTRALSLAFIIGIGTMILSVSAQNSRYLLLEHVKIKTDSNNTCPLIENICGKIQIQKRLDNTLLGCSIWKVASSDYNSSYQYIVATIFSDAGAYLEQYENSDVQKIFIQMADDSLKEVFKKASDSIEVTHVQVYEVLAETGSAGYLPKYMLCTDVKAAPGKRMAYESQEMQYWLPIHKDLIRKGFESAFNFSRLIYPNDISFPYDYSVFRFFEDESMYSKQRQIDWQNYIQKKQGAFVNAGALRIEVHSELWSLVAFLDDGR